MIRFGQISAPSLKAVSTSVIMALVALMPMLFVMALVWQLLVK